MDDTFFKSIIVFIIIGGLVYWGSQLEKNVDQRNKENRCARCNNDLKEEDIFIYENRIICKRCNNRIIQNNSRENLIYKFRWLSLWIVLGSLYFWFALQPVAVLKDELSFPNIIYVISYLYLLVLYPIQKIIKISGKLTSKT